MLKQISVTDVDIRVGVRASLCSCPIALAVSRVVKPTYNVTVGVGHVILMGEHMKIVPLGKVDAWRRAFDIGLTVEPIDFPLELPDWSVDA